MAIRAPSCLYPYYYCYYFIRVSYPMTFHNIRDRPLPLKVLKMSKILVMKITRRLSGAFCASLIAMYAGPKPNDRLRSKAHIALWWFSGHKLGNLERLGKGVGLSPSAMRDHGCETPKMKYPLDFRCMIAWTLTTCLMFCPVCGHYFCLCSMDWKTCDYSSMIGKRFDYPSMSQKAFETKLLLLPTLTITLLYPIFRQGGIEAIMPCVTKIIVLLFYNVCIYVSI